MIMNESVARDVSDLMIDVGKRLNGSVAQVLTECPPEEFKAYRKAVGTIMGEILLNVLNPIYEKHPSLKPPGLE